MGFMPVRIWPRMRYVANPFRYEFVHCMVWLSQTLASSSVRLTWLDATLQRILFLVFDLVEFS